MSNAARPLLPLALASLAACTVAQMKVAPSLTDDRLKVSRAGLFSGDLAFGSYTAAKVDRSWTSSDATTSGNRTDTRAQQTYRFELAAAGSLTDRVRCETVYAETAHSFGRLTLDHGRSGLGCTMTDAGGRPRGELVMTEATPHLPSGRMLRDDVAIDLVPSRTIDGARVEAFAPVGYELRVGGALVGAVQTINGGAVWIDRSAPPALQESAAVAAATLLLYQEIGR